MKNVLDGFMKRRVLVSLTLILLVGSMVRFINLDKSIWFSGDEGRDALVVSQIIETKKPVLQGQASSIVTDIGRVYYGPGFYYQVLLGFLLLNGHPASGAYVVAFFGVLAIILVFLTMRHFFSESVALTVALVYAVNPLVIGMDQRFWSPTASGFFIWLILLSFLEMIFNKRMLFTVILAGALGYVWQLHYTAFFIVLPLIGLFLKYKPQISWQIWVLAAAAFLLVSSPLLISEIRHGFPNIRVLIYYFTQQQKPVFSVVDKLSTVGSWWFRFIFDTITPGVISLSRILIGVGGIVLIVFGRRLGANDRYKVLSTVVGYLLFVTLIPYWGYSGEFAFDSRFLMPFLPIPFLLFGALLNWLYTYKRLGIALALMVVLAVVYINVPKSGFTGYEQGSSLYNRERVVDYMIANSGGKPFDFTVMGDPYIMEAYTYILKYKQVVPNGRVMYVLDESGQMIGEKFGSISVASSE